MQIMQIVQTPSRLGHTYHRERTDSTQVDHTDPADHTDRPDHTDPTR